MKGDPNAAGVFRQQRNVGVFPVDGIELVERRVQQKT
jgi:hypothetical protein